MNSLEKVEALRASWYDETKKINERNVYKPRDSDVIVVGVYKSGTTWVQQILHQIRTKGDETFSDIYQVTWWIPFSYLSSTFNYNAEQVCNPRIYKHHEAYGTFALTPNQKHIFILQDPYDSAYSHSKFMYRYFGAEQDAPDEKQADALKRDLENNRYLKCISTWWEHRNDPNVMVIFYEDLKKNLQQMIERISNFIAIPLNKDELNRVTHFSSFEYMSEHTEKFQGESAVQMISQSANHEPWTPLCGMVRTEGGKIGEGLKHVGPRVKEVIDKFWSEQMDKKFGLKNYEDMYKQYGKFKD